MLSLYIKNISINKMFYKKLKYFIKLFLMIQHLFRYLLDQINTYTDKNPIITLNYKKVKPDKL